MINVGLTGHIGKEESSKRNKTCESKYFCQQEGDVEEHGLLRTCRSSFPREDSFS